MTTPQPAEERASDLRDKCQNDETSFRALKELTTLFQKSDERDELAKELDSVYDKVKVATNCGAWLMMFGGLPNKDFIRVPKSWNFCSICEKQRPKKGKK